MINAILLTEQAAVNNAPMTIRLTNFITQLVVASMNIKICEETPLFFDFLNTDKNLAFEYTTSTKSLPK